MLDSMRAPSRRSLTQRISERLIRMRKGSAEAPAVLETGGMSACGGGGAAGLPRTRLGRAVSTSALSVMINRAETDDSASSSRSDSPLSPVADDGSVTVPPENVRAQSDYGALRPRSICIPRGTTHRSNDSPLAPASPRALLAEVPPPETMPDIGPSNFVPLRLLAESERGCRVYIVRSVGLPLLRDGLFVAKVWDKAHCNRRRAEAELATLKLSSHPFVLSLCAAFQTRKRVYCIVSYGPGGDLGHFLHKQPHRRVSETDTRLCIAELVMAVEYLHLQGFVHRDIKPENIVFNDVGHLKLVDFELSQRTRITRHVAAATDSLSRSRVPSIARRKSLSRTDETLLAAAAAAAAAGGVADSAPSSSACNSSDESDEASGDDESLERRNSLTPPPPFLVRRPSWNRKRGSEATLRRHWMKRMPAPDVESMLQVLPGQGLNGSCAGTARYMSPEVALGRNYGGASDWWSVGVVLYEMLYGRTPFDGDTPEEVLHSVLMDKVTFPTIEGVRVSRHAKSLIRALLEKDESKRLSCPRAIRAHPFFKRIPNWALLRNEPSAFAPGLRDEEDFGNFFIAGVEHNEDWANDTPQLEPMSPKDTIPLPPLSLAANEPGAGDEDDLVVPEPESEENTHRSHMRRSSVWCPPDIDSNNNNAETRAARWEQVEFWNPNVMAWTLAQGGSPRKGQLA